MPRPLRIELENGPYHVTSRGRGRRAIVRDDADRQSWLECGIESSELQLLLDERVSLASISAVSNMPWLMCARRAHRSGGGNSRIATELTDSRLPGFC